MSLSSGPAGGKGVDSNAVDTYDSGDEWDIGVGNLIIDLDADLEKDKLEMSSSKEGGGAMAAPPGAVAALPDNIKFVSPVGSGQGKDSKSKSKRSKNSKEGVKTATPPDAIKKELPGRDPVAQNLSSALTKGGDKSGKASRVPPAVKKDKDGLSAKAKKDKNEIDKEPPLPPGASILPAGAPRGSPFEGQQNSEAQATAEHLGHVALDSVGMGQPVAMTTEEEEDEEEEMQNGECRNLKKMLCGDKMESPSPTPAPPPLHLLAGAANSDISSPCEQIMVRTRSVAVNTADAAQATEPECLGPCEPGTSVNLEGIVWQETEDGMLVVNVTWRNKTYVGTLLDCTRHDWAPPRFCDSPTSDVEMRGGRGRGKRMRPGGGVPTNDNSTSSDNKGSGKTRGGAAGANGKGRRGSQTVGAGGGGAEDAKASPSSAKRKSKAASDMEPTSSSEDTKASKRMRSNSTGAAHPLPAGKPEPPAPPQLDRTCPSPVLIDCPHPNCNKKYKHVNGLKYHQARAHHEHDADKYHPTPAHLHHDADKYHTARPHNHEQDADSEYGDEPGLHPDAASCNGAAISPARSATPKGRGFDAPSPSPGKQPTKHGKKTTGEGEPDGTDGECLTDEASNDGVDDRKAKKMAAGGKMDKMASKGMKPGRPVAPAGPSAPPSYNLQAASPALGSVMQPTPKNNQSKNPSLVEPGSSPLAKDKKKKDKKRREADSPKGARPEEGYAEAGDALLNGSSEAQQSRLASIKAAADKVYSFSDNAPSPSLGGSGRTEGALGQNGADGGVSVQTGSPAYSDISDAGEDGEGKADGVKVKTEPDPKKALFSPQGLPAKEAPYYPNYDAYYPSGYANASPASAAAPLPPHAEGRPKKEEGPEGAEEVKVKAEPQEDRKTEPGPPQPSVIQQRANVYAPPPLYYNQYYAQPYSYSPDQAYHAHLLASSPAYRQQCEERQRLADKMAGDKKAEGKASAGPPTLTPAPALAKPKEAGPEQAKSVIMVKSEDPKAAAPPEGLKMKLSETGHHGKDEAAMWYRQEPDARLWPYVYPNKYSDAPKAQEDEREHDRKLKEERLRQKEAAPQKEEAKEGAEARAQVPPEEQQQQRAAAKEARPAHVQFSAPLAQHQGYVPYMHGPYGYGQAYEPGHPGHPGYRGVPSVMMQNYHGSYLPAGYSFSPYAGKAAAEEGGGAGENASRSSPTVRGAAAGGGEAKALELLQQHASHYKSKSPAADKTPHERDGERPPRSSPSQRGLPAHHQHHQHHHHLAYPLLAGQYDLAYAAGLSSSAMVASQQASAPSVYPPPRR
ncbi:zinc finger protein 609-like [Phycodurus eques]|uniref:zinc finger protein 609-like n=1 Tax=Phycodurus eques TaxID=693459 RepID=UPI002ACDF550|nr:zinc finger protein 609-like [Phycodurus eques]XP_061532352.1 zinc finger protein 609-like [Phycodurus eques]